MQINLLFSLISFLFISTILCRSANLCRKCVMKHTDRCIEMDQKPFVLRVMNIPPTQFNVPAEQIRAFFVGRPTLGLIRNSLNAFSMLLAGLGDVNFREVHMQKLLFHVLLPRVSIDDWNNVYKTAGSAIRMENHDEFISVYGNLLNNDDDLLPFDTLTYDEIYPFSNTLEASLRYGPDYAKYDEVQQIYREGRNDSLNLISSPTGRNKLFNNRFIALFTPVKNMGHNFLTVIDLVKGYVIVIDGAEEYRVKDERFGLEFGEFLRELARRLGKENLFEILHNRSMAWTYLTPKGAVQKDYVSCSYYAMINMKHFAYRTFSSFRNRHVYQLKLMLAYEKINNQLMKMI
ncbi:hypothetical protein SNEBB_002269 [Seison nebaliae]|nr:hypothetical protein SNEBB_002269 [Seison nebaliae]